MLQSLSITILKLDVITVSLQTYRPTSLWTYRPIEVVVLPPASYSYYLTTPGIWEMIVEKDITALST